MKNKQLILPLISLLFLSNGTSFAQSTVFKCVDSEGNISYVNKEESAKCKSTNLGVVDKSATLNKGSVNSVSSNSIADNNFNPNTNSEQIIRDKKRLLILKNELSQEVEQKKTIESMLSKIPANLSQSEEYQKLNNLFNNHKKNIESLEKEIANISKSIPNESVVNNNMGIPTNIAPPVSLPNNLNIKIDPNVQLVAPPTTSNENNGFSKNTIEITKPTEKFNDTVVPKQVKSQETVEESPTKEVFHPSFISNQSLKENKTKPTAIQKKEGSSLLILPLEKK